jgi:glycosyltransferase involved in cell wall biosynthesis
LISIVIPAYNEEARIEVTLSKALTVADEVVVVADGTDRTAQIVKIVKTLIKDPERLVLVESSCRLGKGGAFILGFQVSSGDNVFLVDADFPVDVSYVRYFSHMLRACDVVIGCRHSKHSHVYGQPLSRKLLSFSFRVLCNTLFRLGLQDYQCGFKAFRRDVLDLVLPQMKTVGFAFDVELLVRIVGNDFTVAEFPVGYQYGKGSKVTWKTLIEMLLELWAVKQLNLQVPKVHQYLLK